MAKKSIEISSVKFTSDEIEVWPLRVNLDATDRIMMRWLSKKTNQTISAIIRQLIRQAYTQLQGEESGETVL